jgi:hypothetical protein
MSKVRVLLAPNSMAPSFYMNNDNITKLVQNNLDQYSCSREIDMHLDGESAAEEVFDLTNNPNRLREREVFYGRGRSVSIGDVVSVDNVNYLCGSVGWKVVR